MQSMTDNQAGPVAKESTTNCECPQQVPSTTSTGAAVPPSCPTNVVTIPVPILQSEGNFAYVTVKGSLHDYTCTVFGLNQAEVQALSNRLSVKPCVNGVLVAVPPMVMLNTLAQLSYKVVCSCGEAEICWTMQREV
ncbi:uncharacterized protein LOC6575670 isoform X1 [Drosophila mojavensis]|uniref:Uncharacterized protein, isoform B n=2 Tax=mojavensis species complex TaxID=198037 RepID=A0A0Q9XCZ3_DROMO|nr:uncharacterized protein LOC6575670 isoform X1 [Drosophila mojavensis]XP_017858045.1 PREDICTED: uncharacterized protein LOC108610452 isoform X1 [Drosophila arizonae]KRG02530.1 uncharacterized protein Dmoj_GI16981, isoform B [Drosophila mojavensis]